MEKELIKEGFDLLAPVEGDIVNLLNTYFYPGNFEHHVGLISNAMQEVINKGSGDSDDSLDNSFDFTNRYIRESINDFAELQKFLVRLHIVYAAYQRKNNYLFAMQNENV